MANNKSLAVWDVPMPVAIGENFAIKVGGAKGADEPEPAFADGPEVDCRAVRGLEHTIIDSAPAGKSLRITVAVAGDIKPAKAAWCSPRCSKRRCHGTHKRAMPS